MDVVTALTVFERHLQVRLVNVLPLRPPKRWGRETLPYLLGGKVRTEESELLGLSSQSHPVNSVVSAEFKWPARGEHQFCICCLSEADGLLILCPENCAQTPSPPQISPPSLILLS